MIELLRISDFALVSELSLEVEGGFTVLTGETGAGKSILLQALGLLLGERASRDGVRAGAAQARVEGLFCPAGSVRLRLQEILSEAGIPWEEGEPLLVTRTVGADGRSRAQVNGALVPLGHLSRIGAHLVEVSSQHQHQGLLREDGHVDLLDAALDPEGQGALTEYGRAYRLWSESEAEVRRIENRGADAAQRAEFLRFQIGEIRSARLEAGEDRKLQTEREILAHATKLLESYARAEAELYSGADAALDRVARAVRELEGAARRDTEIVDVLDLLAEARRALEETAFRLRERQASLEADPNRLDAVEERLEAIRRLERKHGAGVETILDRAEALEAELAGLENAEFELEETRNRRARAAEELRARALELRSARQRGARRLEGQIGAELEVLALGRACFRVELEPCDPGPRGGETARFLLAPNPGEPPRPLARIASGGELSRILLALKNALRDSSVETLVFDEVDAGVGGATADAVGDRLAALARSCQVICITHLPQIASRALRHLRVEKKVDGGRTVTRVRALDRGERVEELARMLGGRHVTEATLRHASELLERQGL